MRPDLKRQRLRHALIQALTIGLVIGALALVASMVRQRLESMGIAVGFGFLWNRAGYDIGESLLPYTGDDSYARALLAGLSNTLKVAVSSIFAALLIGLMAAAAMLSGHPTANRIGKFYIRTVRNTPLLLQLFFWFGLFTVSLPAINSRLTLLPGVYLSNRGLNFPTPDGRMWVLCAVALAVLVLTFFLTQRRKLAGRGSRWLPLTGVTVAIALFPIATAAGFGGLEYPEVGRFAIKGGAVMTPEFLTLFVGLSVYTGTYIAEVLRGAVRSVAKGQSEAAASLGLSRAQAFRLVIFPQATRVAMPAVVSELLNLVKNSSLGVAVGYPDLVSVGNTAMNQTGQAIELISIYMIAYVSINVIITKISQVLEARYEW